MKILIVDDKKENRYLLETMLRGNGYEVVSAANGAEALEKLQAEGFDMIISDILMPVMDGFQLCREVKRDSQLKTIPFVFYTATYTDVRDEELALKTGADRFIRKPVEPDEFMEIIRETIKESEAGRIEPRSPDVAEEEERLRLYSERLVKKLEKKMLDLESALARQREGEKELGQVNRALRMITKCNEVLIRATREQDLLDEICRIIVEMGGYRLAWVGYAEKDEDKTVRPIARAGYEEGYIATVGAAWADTERGRGPTGTAIRTGVPFIVEDILTDPRFAPWRDEAHKRGYASVIALPLMDDGQAFGALTIYGPEPGPVYGEELKLLKELTDDLAYGIAALRMREEHAKADQVLKESEEKYRLHFENVTDVIYSLDQEFRVISISPSVEKVLGYRPEELTGRVFQELNLLAPASVENAVSDATRVFQGETLSGRIYEFVARDGKRRFGEVSGSPMIREGKVVSIVSVARDITERKVAEEEKARLEEQFLQAQKMEAIGTLAGGIAHDFNNLLSIIMGHADLSLMRIKKDDPLCKDIEEIKKAGQRAASLTRQILAFSRKQIIQPKVLDLNDIIRTLEKMLGRLIGEDITFETTLDPALSPVEVDPGQMEQVVMNLAVNARDAMPQGGRFSIVSANVFVDEGDPQRQPEMTAGPYVLLTVTDTGVGMDKETETRIFDPFFTTKAVGRGTGLGLSTVYGIVKQNGGHIHVESQLGEGSAFRIYLPAQKEGARGVKEAKAQPERLTGSETVLVVEDDEPLRRLASTILRRHGYTVLEAQDGDSALMVSKGYEGPIHLILTDVVMPGMNVREMAEKIRSMRPEVKILYTSGYTDDTIVQYGILEPGIALLEKPITPDALLRKVREVL